MIPRFKLAPITFSHKEEERVAAVEVSTEDLNKTEAQLKEIIRDKFTPLYGDVHVITTFMYKYHKGGKQHIRYNFGVIKVTTINKEEIKLIRVQH